jgi:hypothetical protein
MGQQLYKPFWQVERNAAHDIPEGAAFCIEGFRRSIRFEIESDSSRASIKVIESKLRKKVPAPIFYWQVGKGTRHEMPEMAVVRFKIDSLVRCELMLTAVFAVLEFYRRRSPKKGGDVVVSTTGPGDQGILVAIPRKSLTKTIRSWAWCLDDPHLDSVEKEVKKGKNWRPEECHIGFLVEYTEA